VGNALVTFSEYVQPKNAAEILKISLLIFSTWQLETDTQPANDQKISC